MKLIYIVILFFSCVVISRAQTNANTNGVEAILALVTTNQPAPPAAKNAPVARGPIVIQETGPVVLDMKNHWMTYSKNVIVTNGQWKLTCEWLMADLPQNGNFTNIVAETNVVLDFTTQNENGQKGHGTGEKAVYYYHVENGVTNETITLTGTPGNPPVVHVGQDVAMHDTYFVYDCITGQIMGYGQFTGVYAPTTNSPAATNQAAIPKLF